MSFLILSNSCLKQDLHFYIQRKASNNGHFHHDGMMIKMISETENITQQHGPDKQKGYTV